MKRKYLLGVVLCVLACVSLGMLQACSTPDTLESELIDPTYELEFKALANDEVEIRQVSDGNQDLAGNQAYYIDFENENMALMVPLSLLQQAEEKNSFIAMRYHYPEGSGGELINFYLPYISEYELYFAGAAPEDISLMVADVVVSEEDSTAIRAGLEAAGVTASEQEPVYATMMYLVDTSSPEPVALKLDSIEEQLIMREKGSVDEESFNTRIYLSEEGDIYRPMASAYHAEAEEDSSFIDSYFYGSFVTTQGQTEAPAYEDIAGHYAANAIKQVQLSRNMAEAITKESVFEPDSTASIEDVLNAQGAFCSQPLMSRDTYEQSRAGILERYGVDQMFEYLIDPDNDIEVRSYVARVPYQTAEVYEALGLEGKMDAPMNEGLALNSRISAALLGMGSYWDDASEFEIQQYLPSDPSAEDADEWLTGIIDVAEDDPLRPYAAIAVKYGLLFPNSEGELNIYEPISRADLCLVYASLDKLYALASDEAETVYEGYSQKYVYNHDPSLHFTLEGTWDLSEATRADGTSYSPEEVKEQQASFTFTLGESLEQWTGEEYESLYLFCASNRSLTLYYSNGQYETLTLNDDLTQLTYHYVYDEDPEFSGETYVFKRAAS